MDNLKASLAQKRRAIDELKGPKKKKKKFMTRGEIEAEREREVREREAKLAAEAWERGKAEREALEAAAAKEIEKHTKVVEAEVVDLPPKEDVFRRLRALKQPVTYFGESDQDRYKRVLDAESNQSEFMPGEQNVFAQALADYQADLDEELVEGGDKEGALKRIEEIEATLWDVDETIDSFESVYRLLSGMLNLWSAVLDARDVDEKRSVNGRHKTATLLQTKEYIKPLFKALKEKTLEEDILVFLVPICQAIREREYLRASDLYLQLSIGNAPWPIGVTMVGIHERSGREKIFASKTAHVLNDETQRKYIQSLKRLMTFSQNRFPNDPSKNF